MNILIAGASGFIGQELVRALATTHSITVLGRDKEKLRRLFSKDTNLATWEELPQLDAKTFDAVINLSGYNIAASRWNPNVKKQIIDSRVQSSQALVNWAIQQQAQPHFYCANAVGIYGLQENGSLEQFDESSPIDFEHPRDFMSEIGIKWEEALQPASDHNMPVTTLRFGVVLKKGQGMLKKLAPSFYMGLGSVVGDGKQMISWVHVDDLVHAIVFLLNKPELTGPFNLTAPNPVSQAEFARVLANCMHRPLLLKTPAFVITTLFGEMGDCLLLKGQQVIPKRLSDAGYTFCYPRLTDALSHEFRP